MRYNLCCIEHTHGDNTESAVFPRVTYTEAITKILFLEMYLHMLKGVTNATETNSAAMAGTYFVATEQRASTPRHGISLTSCVQF